MRRSLLTLLALLAASPATGRGAPAGAPGPDPEAGRVASSRAIAHYLAARRLALGGDREGAVAALRLAVAHDPQSPEVRVALAEALSRTGRGEEADEKAREAIALAPRSRAAAEAWALTGRLRAARGAVTDAKEALEAALAIQRALADEGIPIEPQPWRLLGEIRLATGDQDGAVALFEELSARLPGEGGGFRLLGMLREDAGDLTGAERWYERALGADPTDTDARRRLAQVHEGLRRTPEARDDLTALLRFDPDDEEALLALGRLALEAGSSGEAREWFARLQRSAADPADAALRIALAWIDAGQGEAALAAARAAEADLGPRPRLKFAEGIALQALHRYRESAAALRQVPPSAGDLHLLARDALAYALSREGRHREAERALEAALAARPGDPRFISRRAWILQRSGRAAEAAALLERTLAERSRGGAEPRADEAATELWQALGEALEWAGRPSEAVDALARAAEARPRDATLLYALGAAYERAGRPEAAIAQMRAVLAIDPENAGAMNFIGYAFAERGERLDEAEALVRRALELRPRSAGILDSMGWIAFKRGQYATAVELLERAAQLGGPDAVVLDHLGDTYRALKRLADAEGAWREALRHVGEQSPTEATRLRGSLEQKLRTGGAAAARAP